MVQDGEHIKRRRSDSEDTGSKLVKRYGIGAKLLAQMGYREGQGLGKDGSGISTPIAAEKMVSGKVGLGSTLPGDDSSSDEEEHPVYAVSFAKSGTETFNGDEDVEEMVASLHLDSDLTATVLEKLGTKQDSGFSRFAKQLEQLQSNESAMKARLTALKDEVEEIDADVALLEELNFACKDDGISLSDRAAVILKHLDDELVDKLLAALMFKSTQGIEWDVFDMSNIVLTEISSTIEMLKFRMDTQVAKLNRTQTVIFDLVWEKLLPYWVSFQLDESVNVLNLLLSYDVVLSFINCVEFITNKYIFPQVVSAVTSWDIAASSAVVTELIGFMVILDNSSKRQIGSILEDKFFQYCHQWRPSSPPLLETNLLFLKEIIPTDKYESIIQHTFLPNFLDYLWDDYFDPLLDLEQYKEIDNHSSGITYFYETLRKHRIMFNDEFYDRIIHALFNEINKILYQWQLYGPEGCRKGALSWFNWIVNRLFAQVDPIELELKEIRKTLDFLNAVSSPIHDELLDLRSELLADHRESEAGGTETVKNVPLRKVKATFKDVLEDFCEQRGYLLNKEENAFALLQGVNLPVFRISNTSLSKRVVIKDDVLWVLVGKNKYVPKYLWELKL